VPTFTVVRGTAVGEGDGEGDGFGAGGGEAADAAAAVGPGGAADGADVEGPGGAGGRVGSVPDGIKPQPAMNSTDSTSHRAAFSTNRSLVGWAAARSAWGARERRRLRG
jgi:hypothetical protein